VEGGLLLLPDGETLVTGEAWYIVFRDARTGAVKLQIEEAPNSHLAFDPRTNTIAGLNGYTGGVEIIELA
jgi:hypothetical protein